MAGQSPGAGGATRIAVGIATAAPMTKEVSQADARFDANPSPHVGGCLR